MDRAKIIREALAAGRDPHTATAAVVFGIPEDKVTTAQRQCEKQWNYIFLYSNPVPLEIPYGKAS